MLLPKKKLKQKWNTLKLFDKMNALKKILSDQQFP